MYNGRAEYLPLTKEKRGARYAMVIQKFIIRVQRIPQRKYGVRHNVHTTAVPPQ